MKVGDFVKGISTNYSITDKKMKKAFDREELLKRMADGEKEAIFDYDLRGADLRGADLSDANLRGADLRGADLMTEANIEVAKEFHRSSECNKL